VELDIDAQETVIDLLEILRTDSGSIIDRRKFGPGAGARTRPVLIQVHGASQYLSLIFKYGSDESTIHIVYFVTLPL